MNLAAMIKRTLQKAGIIPAVSNAEIDAADTENIERSVRDHDSAVELLVDASKRYSDSNFRLRETIQRARASSVFSDLEISLRHAGVRRRDR